MCLLMHSIDDYNMSVAFQEETGTVLLAVRTEHKVNRWDEIGCVEV